MWPQLKEKQNKQAKPKEGYLSVIFSNNSLDLVSPIQMGKVTADIKIWSPQMDWKWELRELACEVSLLVYVLDQNEYQVQIK